MSAPEMTREEAAAKLQRWLDGARTDLSMLDAVKAAVGYLRETRECIGCKHWTVDPFARDFQKQNQYGECRGMRACGVDIKTTGDCSIDEILTDATFHCGGWEAR